MSLDFSRIISAIEEMAPPSLQAPWDKSGLQVASTRTKISKMAVCLDPVPDMIVKALNADCDFILAHHPLSLKPELPNRLNNWHRVLQLLLSANVPLYSAHTSLDVNIEGPAGWLGRALKLEDAKPLEPLPGNFSYGYGQIGLLPREESLDDIAARLMSLLDLDSISACGPRAIKPVKKLAYCGGSGSSLMENAYTEGASLFVTGDVKYHSALEAPVAMLDVGHHSMEQEMMRQAAHDLELALPDLEIIFLSMPNPFYHIYKI